MPRQDESNGTGTLGKAMDVLDAIARSPTRLRFTDLLKQVDQPRGTLHRQISNLLEEGLLAVGRDQTYELGIRLLRLASHSWSDNRFRSIAEPHLRKLHDATGETVHLGVLAGSEVVYLDKVESRQAVRMYSQIGNASPVYCTGVGKAALSALPEAEAERRIAKIQFRGHTPNTLADADALRRELAEIRARGIAYDREEHEPGIHCVAAPIYSRERDFVAAVSVTAPSYRIPAAKLSGWEPLVRGTAEAVMEDMATRLGPRA